MEELKSILELKNMQLAYCLELIEKFKKRDIFIDIEGAIVIRNRLTDEIAGLNEDIRNKRMDIVGQNGNEGTHYGGENSLQTIAEDEE